MSEQWQIPREFLKHRTTVAQAEAESLAQLAGTEYAGVVFGFANQMWNDFKRQGRRGDELWWYSTTFEVMSGSAGYAIIRHGRTIAEFPVIMA